MKILAINGSPVTERKATSPQATHRVSLVPRPGSLLGIAIRLATGESPCGACLDRKSEMDAKGWVWCWRNRSTIAGWLSEEARKRGHSIDQNKAADLVSVAFREMLNYRRKNIP